LRRQRATCDWCRLTALRWPGGLWLRSADGVATWRLLGVCLFFTEARLVRRAVQWRPMKPESWSSWFPLEFMGRKRSCDLSWSAVWTDWAKPRRTNHILSPDRNLIPTSPKYDLEALSNGTRCLVLLIIVLQNLDLFFSRCQLLK
jgi:hypothetical protein